MFQVDGDAGMRGRKFVAKRNSSHVHIYPPQLTLFGTESSALGEGLKNLPLAAERSAVSGESLSPILIEGARGVTSLQNRGLQFALIEASPRDGKYP